MGIAPSFLQPRCEGILLPISSLAGPYGIGELGNTTFQWLKFLHETGQRLWQILPIHPTGMGNSPYQSSSAMAYNPMLISLEQLRSDGLLSPEDFADFPCGETNHIDYESLIPLRHGLLQKAAKNFLRDGLPVAFKKFLHTQREWLDDYSLFRCIGHRFGTENWSEWPKELRNRDPHALEKFRAEGMDGIHVECVWQYFFHRQWEDVRKLAAELSIKIIGDMPIFVSHRSADVWAHRELFDLRDDGNPRVVAGVPPDYFSCTGQRWGNPLYRWECHRQTDYAWWVQRLRHSMSLYDVLRIDHFRAFADYWEITAESETALNGHWVTGPGVQFFDAIKRQLGPLPLIAEDLGILSAAAIQLRDQLKIPGLRILLFAFDTDDPHSPFLPQNFIENCVAYTGTHDNNTATGAFDSANVDANGISVGRRRRQILRKYLPKEYEFLPLHEGLLRWLCGSAAQWIIYPMQDVLALGREARLNTPGVPLGNWEWKLCTEQLEGKVRFFLQQLAKREGV